MGCNILVIDDSEAMRRSLREVLEGLDGVDDILLAADGLQGFKILREKTVDLILCDLNMPGLDGFKFLGLKGSDKALGDIPVIMLTAQGAVESKVRGLEAGASDYLTKPFDAPELAARVNVHLKMKRLQDELREKNQQLERMVRTDALTGLANRRYFMETLDYEYNRFLRYKRPLSLVMMDLDHFKKVNDTHGHQAGDATLVIVAKTMKRAVRMQDLVGRYGGEEFAMLLPETPGQSAVIVANRCRQLIQEVPVKHQDLEFSITASLGIASVPESSVGSLDELVGLADKALYEAKRKGRNRVVLA